MFVNPMLLQSVGEPFDDNRYIFEMKFDGHRLILSSNGGETHLYTRHGTDCSMQYPELLHPPVDHDVILDGEVIFTDSQQNVDFEQVMKRFRITSEFKIQQETRYHPVQFIVFDVLSYRGRDLTLLPLSKRKEILEQIIDDNENFIKVRYIHEYGRSFFDQIQLHGIEGMVAKKWDSPYYVRHRSRNWLKVINYGYTNAFISGYKKQDFGWIVSGTSDGAPPYGTIEFGPSPDERKAFYRVTRPYIFYEDHQIAWINPKIPCRIKYRTKTKNGNLRIPIFEHFIFDEGTA